MKQGVLYGQGQMMHVEETSSISLAEVKVSNWCSEGVLIIEFGIGLGY